jgi:hypothetical protein
MHGGDGRLEPLALGRRVGREHGGERRAGAVPHGGAEGDSGGETDPFEHARQGAGQSARHLVSVPRRGT